MNELERARLLAAIARDAAASSDLEGCLRAAMERLHQAIRFKGGSLAFPDDDGLLAIRVAVGVIDEAALAVRLRPGQGIVGTVFSTGESFRTGDLDHESRVTPAARAIGTNRLLRSFLCVPLAHQGTVVGILEIDSASEDAFSAEDQELLETAATVLAGVVSLAHIAERERAARLARDDFFAAVTHDLRNPLTVIRGQTQRLLRRHHADPDTAPLGAILTQTDRLNRMVTSLLDVARFQSGSGVTLQPRPVRIDEIVSHISRAVVGPEHEDRLALDDPRVLDGMDRGGRRVGQAREVGPSADAFELVAPLERLGHRDDVDRLAALEQLEDRLEDLAVRLPVEVRWPQELGHLDDRVTVDEDRAEHRLLGFEALGRQAINHGHLGSWRLAVSPSVSRPARCAL